MFSKPTCSESWWVRPMMHSTSAFVCLMHCSTHLDACTTNMCMHACTSHTYYTHHTSHELLKYCRTIELLTSCYICQYCQSMQISADAPSLPNMVSNPCLLLVQSSNMAALKLFNMSVLHVAHKAGLFNIYGRAFIKETKQKQLPCVVLQTCRWPCPHYEG